MHKWFASSFRAPLTKKLVCNSKAYRKDTHSYVSRLLSKTNTLLPGRRSQRLPLEKTYYLSFGVRGLSTRGRTSACLAPVSTLPISLFPLACRPINDSVTPPSASSIPPSFSRRSGAVPPPPLPPCASDGRRRRECAEDHDEATDLPCSLSLFPGRELGGFCPPVSLVLFPPAPPGRQAGP